MEFYQLINCNITFNPSEANVYPGRHGLWRDAYRILQRLRGECTQRVTNGPTFCQFIFHDSSTSCHTEKTVDVR